MLEHSTVGLSYREKVGDCGQGCQSMTKGEYKTKARKKSENEQRGLTKAGKKRCNVKKTKVRREERMYRVNEHEKVILFFFNKRDLATGKGKQRGLSSE